MALDNLLGIHIKAFQGFNIHDLCAHKLHNSCIRAAAGLTSLVTAHLLLHFGEKFISFLKSLFEQTLLDKSTIEIHVNIYYVEKGSIIHIDRFPFATCMNRYIIAF